MHPALGWRVRVRRLRPRRHALRACRCSCCCAIRRGRADARRPHDVSPVGALRELLGNGSFILLVLYFTLPALAGWVVRDWMPAILKQQFGIGQGQAGVVGDALLAGRGHRRRGRRRLAGRSLDAANDRAAASSSAPSAWR